MTYRYGKMAFLLLALLLASWATYMGACRATSPGPAAAGQGGGGPSGPVRQLRPHGDEGLVAVALEPGETEVMVIYCGVTHGAIEACGCNGNPTGGMTKELTIVEQLRSRGIPSLYLHPGDLFPFKKRSAKMKFIAEAASLMGYDAMCIGEQELIEGLDRFRELATEYRLPYLSENLRDKEGGRIAPGYCIKDLGGIKVGIVALFGTESYLFLDEAFLKDVTLNPVPEALKSVLQELDGRVDYLILLSHRAKYLDRELACQFPQFNLIIGGHDEELIPTPIRVGHTLIVNAGIVSEQIGVLHLAVDPQRHVRVLGHEFVATSAPIPKHPKIEAIYKEYIRVSKEKPEENEPTLPEAYQSSETCEPCHKAVYKEFLESNHAKAWQTLVDAGRTEDAECWYCHTMGYGHEGGFRNIKETPELANVSCQACHLVTHDHDDRDIKDDLEYCQDENTCEHCHTTVTSRKWNFWEYSEKIDHHAVKEKSNDPPADYKHWRVKPVRKPPAMLDKKKANDAKAAKPAGRGE